MVLQYTTNSQFCFLEFSGIFFPNIFDTWLVEPRDAKSSDMEVYLYIEFLKWINTIWPDDGVNIPKTQEEKTGENRGIHDSDFISHIFFLLRFSKPQQ